MHQTIVCRRDGHNSILTGVFQQIGPVLLLSDDRLVCFSFSPGSSFRLDGREGYAGNRRGGEEPRNYRKFKKTVLCNMSINLINTLNLKNFKNIKKPYSYYINIYYIRAYARYYLSLKYKYLLE